VYQLIPKKRSGAPGYAIQATGIAVNPSNPLAAYAHFAWFYPLNNSRKNSQLPLISQGNPKFCLLFIYRHISQASLLTDNFQ
jgi:hypothetical protein